MELNNRRIFLSTKAYYSITWLRKKRFIGQNHWLVSLEAYNFSIYKKSNNKHAQHYLIEIESINFLFILTWTFFSVTPVDTRKKKYN